VHSIDRRTHHSGAALKRATALLASTLAGGLLFAASASAQVAPPPDTPPPTTTPSAYTQVFPIPSSVAHTYGDGFGAGRGHQGQDIFAPCLSPLVSISWARVIFIGTHPSAGNYMVLRYKKLKQDYMYAHMAGKPIVRKKAKVAPGQQVGYVGDTGNASGCHLHFELWVGRWYRGGRAVNPLESLQYWDSYS